KKLLFISILALGILHWTTVCYNQTNTIAFHLSNLNIQNTHVQKLNSDLPINITSNSQFGIYGFPGSGTPDDPYQIENLNISTSSDVQINIKNTTVHFSINGCTLDGGTMTRSGISLTNVKHVTLENNVIIHNQDGISVFNSSHTVILNNSIYSNTRFGIFLVKINNCTLTSNTVHDNLINGVHLKDTANTTINHNTIYNHQYGEYSQCGILLDNSSNTLIANNSVFNNHYGLKFLHSANNNLLSNNTIYDNQEQGICLEYASGNTIVYNNISDNLLYGILITDGSNDNTIQFNSFIGNNAGDTQAMDDGISNTYIGNYWDDLPILDMNEDLIIDNPYPIDGKTNNSDPCPLVELSVEAIANFGKNPDNSGVQLFILVFLALIMICTGGGFYLYNTRFKQHEPETTFETEETFTEFAASDQIDRLKPLYHKIIVGLENIQALALPEPAAVPLLKPAETITLVDYFPSEIKEDLQSGLKWRTILTLIEIAYQDPSETNVVKLSKSMDIPRSTLSKEIKRLSDLQYIESFVTSKVLRDARFRNYEITPKGFKLIFILKEVFKMAITRIKEKQGDYYA
ncbi:MAG: NosD domain-containing protein, partial [Candidatus Hodarchaeales archaeon]